MGRIPEETIEKIISSNDIVDIISQFVPLRKSGNSYMGVCPFHSDKGPSMSVSPTKQLYHCFGCGASGNTVGFLMKLRNIDFIDAIKYLADKAGIQIEDVKEDPRITKEKTLKDIIYQINLESARYFYANRLKNGLCSNYLKLRELDGETIKKFGLGYSLNQWDGLFKYLKRKGYKEELIAKAGLIIPKQNGYYDRFRNRLMFPVFDIKKRIIGFGGRVFDDSKPKYLNSPETPVFHKGTNLYGLNFVISSGIPESIIIVEGYMDCISLHQNGINNVVASLGTALTQEQAKLLRRYSKNIYICYDSDAAGQTATIRGLDILSQANCDVRIIKIPKGKDPDEFIKANGVQEFKRLIESAMPIIDYRIERALVNKNLKNIKDKIAFLNETSEILSKLESEIEVQTYAARVSEQTGVDTKAILDEVKKIKAHIINKENNQGILRDNNISGNIYNFEPAYKKAEKELLRFSLNDNECFRYISSKINEDDFVTNSYKVAANVIFEKLKKGENIMPIDVLKSFEDQNDINDISQIFQSDAEIVNDYGVINDYVKTLKKFNIENNINQLTTEIKKFEEENDIVKSAELFQQLVVLRKQLNQL